jgi:hypothetical protein
MRKVLIFKEVSRTGTEVEIRIAEQSHRAFDFGSQGHQFKASNGILFCSNAIPAAMFPVVWTRGSDWHADYIPISCSVELWEKIQAASAEYNNYEFEDIEESPKAPESRPVEADARLKVISFIMAALPRSEFAGYDEMAIEAVRRADAVMERINKGE